MSNDNAAQTSIAPRPVQDASGPAWAPVADRGQAGTGNVLAVVGAKGSPGASQLAASFAAVVARQHRVLLVELDADDCGRGRRGDAEAGPDGFLGLVRAVAAGEASLETLVAPRAADASDGRPETLTGGAGSHLELTAASAPGLVQRVLRLLAASYPLLVCDLGHRLRQQGGGDLAARLHREVALAADAHLVVLGARPDQLGAGIAQLDLLLDELAIVPEAVRVVVNGQPGLPARRAGTGRVGIADELASRGLVVDAWLPFDERALRLALRSGSTLAAARPRGGYARAVAALASELLLSSPPRPARRKRRLVLNPGQHRGRADSDPEVALPWRQG